MWLILFELVKPKNDTKFVLTHHLNFEVKLKMNIKIMKNKIVIAHSIVYLYILQITII